MNSSVFIDPQIDLESKEMVEIIVQFTTNPAKTQIVISKGSISLEEANLRVKESHLRFQQDLWEYLDKHQLPYMIMNQYQEAFNGVAMKMRGKDIHRLLQSNEIGAIYLNKTISVPLKPNDPKYQL